MMNRFVFVRNIINIYSCPGLETWGFSFQNGVVPWSVAEDEEAEIRWKRNVLCEKSLDVFPEIVVSAVQIGLCISIYFNILKYS